MNSKLRYALIPTFIGLGPLFMTKLGGLFEKEFGYILPLTGSIMLALGLSMMFELIGRQQMLIEELQIEVAEKGSEKAME